MFPLMQFDKEERLVKIFTMTTHLCILIQNHKNKL